MSKSILSKITKIFKSINIYGVNIPLLYKKDEIFNTTLGVLLSILSYIIIILVSLFYSLELFNKSSFSLTKNTNQIDGEYYLNFSNLPILLSFSDLNGTSKELDPTLVNLKFIHQINKPELINGKNYINLSLNEIELEECKINNINSKLIEEGYNINNYMCVKKGQNLYINGRFGDSKFGFSFLQITLNKCQNGSNIICKSEEEINKYFHNSYLNLIYLSYSVNHYNVTYPIIEIYRNDGFSLSFNFLRRYFYYFSPSIYESHKRLFFNKIKYHKFFEFELIYPDIIDKDVNIDYTKNNPSMLEIFITFYCREKHYVRKYVTLQDVLGNIGGFLDITLLFFQYLSVYLSEKSFICDLMNTIVNTEYVKNGKFQKSKILKKITGKCDILSKINIQKNNLHLEKSSNYFIQTIQGSKIYINNYIGMDKKLNLNIDLNQKQKSNFYIFEYIFPFWFLKFSKKYELLFLFYDNIRRLLSIEILIPVIDNFNKVQITENEIN